MTSIETDDRSRRGTDRSYTTASSRVSAGSEGTEGGRHPYRIFWSSTGPRIEAVYPSP